MTHDYESKTRLLAKLLRELLDSDQFESLADLTDALKGRCSKLKITYRDDDITNAMRLIASNRELAERSALLESRRTTRAVAESEELIPRVQASRIYEELMARYRHEHPPAPKESGPDAPEHFPSLMPV